MSHTDLSCNIELKARCADLPAARAAAMRLGAAPQGVLRQTDTYFHARHGRLKLREINGERAELIWYERPDDLADRASHFRVTPVTNAGELRGTLERALGVRGTVRKHRELLLWQNVRIHLDEVQGLGTFLEFEAVVSPAADEQISRVRIAELTSALGIAQADRVAVSYSDLLGI